MEEELGDVSSPPASRRDLLDLLEVFVSEASLTARHGCIPPTAGGRVLLDVIVRTYVHDGALYPEPVRLVAVLPVSSQAIDRCW